MLPIANLSETEVRLNFSSIIEKIMVWVVYMYAGV